MMAKFGFLISGDVPIEEDPRGLSIPELLELWQKQAHDTPNLLAKDLLEMDLANVAVRIYQFPDPPEYDVCPACNAANFGNASCSRCHEDWVSRGTHDASKCGVCQAAKEEAFGPTVP